MLWFKSKKIEQKVQEVLSRAVSELTASDIDNAKVLIDNGEFDVAFELICEQLYEYDAEISSELLASIRSAADTMKLNESTWNFLEKK